MNEKATLDEAKQVELLIDASKDNYATFRDNVWKLAGFGLIAIGWIMTSDQARTHLGNHPTSRIILILTFTLAGLAHCLVNYKMYTRSHAIVSRLAESIEKSVFENYQVTIALYVANACAVLCLLIFGIILVLTAK